MNRIKISVPDADIEVFANLNDSETSQKLWDMLPCESPARLWGDEVYFAIPLSMPSMDGQAEVPGGTIAYWPDGKCFCIFFGQKPYSPVNVLGMIEGDAEEFRKVAADTTIRLERAE